MDEPIVRVLLSWYSNSFADLISTNIYRFSDSYSHVPSLVSTTAYFTELGTIDSCSRPAISFLRATPHQTFIN